MRKCQVAGAWWNHLNYTCTTQLRFFKVQLDRLGNWHAAHLQQISIGGEGGSCVTVVHAEDILESMLTSSNQTAHSDSHYHKHVSDLSFVKCSEKYMIDIPWFLSTVLLMPTFFLQDSAWNNWTINGAILFTINLNHNHLNGVWFLQLVFTVTTLNTWLCICSVIVVACHSTKAPLWICY